MLAALVRADNGRVADLFDEVEAHMRDRCRAVESAFGLHLPDDVLKRFLLVLVEVELFQNEWVTFCELGRGEADRKLRRTAWSSMRCMMACRQRCTCTAVVVASQ